MHTSSFNLSPYKISYYPIGFEETQKSWQQSDSKIQGLFRASIDGTLELIYNILRTVANTGIYLRNWCEGRIDKPEVSKINQVFVRCLPYIGIAMGIGMGFMLRHGSFSDSGLSYYSYKHRDICAAFASKSGFLAPILRFKQWEFKNNMALLTPVIPLVSSIVSDIARANPKNAKQNSLKKKVQIALKSQLSAKQLLYISTVLVLSLANPLYERRFGFKTATFDSSGHVMLRMALATLVGQVSNNIEQKEPKKGPKFLNRAFVVLYAMTDAAFLTNTAAHCHSVPEISAGLGWAAAIHTFAALVTSVASRAIAA